MSTEQAGASPQPSSAMKAFLEAARAAREKAKEIASSPGLAPLWAEGRRGLKDLQDFVLQAFPDSKATREEPGTIGSPTPQIITEQMTGRHFNMDMDR